MAPFGEHPGPKTRFTTDEISMAATIKWLEQERDELRAKLSAIIEIYAGMEGFIPETAPEAYQARIIEQMYNAAVKL